MTNQPSSLDFITASKAVEHARDSLVASGQAVGPHVEIPFAGGQVAAYRAGDRISYEVIGADGSFASHTSGGAARTIAHLIAARFA